MNNTTNIKDSIEQQEKQAGIQLPVNLRDYFAAKAMQALIDNDGLFVVIPTQAYAIADVMMKARETK